MLLQGSGTLSIRYLVQVHLIPQTNPHVGGHSTRQVLYLQFASDHVKEINTLKTRYKHTLEALGEEPSPDSIISAPVIGFGYGKQKLHKTLMDALRSNEARLLNPQSMNQRAEAMPRDDPRA